MKGTTHAIIGTTASVIAGATLVYTGTHNGGIIDTVTTSTATVGMIAIGGLVGSLMPDIDSPKSKSNKVFKNIIAFIGLIYLAGIMAKELLHINLIMDNMKTLENLVSSNYWLMAFAILIVLGHFSSHRGFTHKWFGTILYLFVCYHTFNLDFTIGFSIGYILHIMADTLTKAGRSNPMYFWGFQLPLTNSKGKFKVCNI